jgi:multidrug efflux system membrane fusion protein
MAKAKIVLLVVGLAGAAAAYMWRDEILPWVGAHVPGAIAAVPSDGKQAEAGKGGGPADGAKGGGRRGPGGVAPVLAAKAEARDMPVILTAPGTVEALATVAIKPRVDGSVIEVGFKEGDAVVEGQLLFQLDDRLIRAQIKQAEANVAKDRATLKDAEVILERKQALLQKQYTSEAVTETQKANVEALRASIAAGEALIEAQKTQLDYLAIRAPITGRTGATTAKLGQFVRSADTLPIVTINQTKPIAVSFALPQVELAAVKAALAQKAKADIVVSGSRPMRMPGELTFVDNQVDKQTGTVTAKVTAPNTDEALWPGLSVLIELTVETRKNVVAVPATAVLPAQQGMIAWIVDKDNKVSYRVVKVERIMGSTAYLTDGIKAGDTVVTDGQIRLAPGMTVAVQDPANPGQRGGGAGGQKKGDGGAAPNGSAKSDRRPDGPGAGTGSNG